MKQEAFRRLIELLEPARSDRPCGGWRVAKAYAVCPAEVLDVPACARGELIHQSAQPLELMGDRGSSPAEGELRDCKGRDAWREAHVQKSQMCAKGARQPERRGEHGFVGATAACRNQDRLEHLACPVACASRQATFVPRPSQSGLLRSRGKACAASAPIRSQVLTDDASCILIPPIQRSLAGSLIECSTGAHRCRPLFVPPEGR
jgi:hypothetical protein